MGCEAKDRADENIVRLLLQKGANVNARDLERKTPLNYARWRGYRDIERILFDNGGL